MCGLTISTILKFICNLREQVEPHSPLYHQAL